MARNKAVQSEEVSQDVEVNAVGKEKVSRVRRVSSEVVAPNIGEHIGTITYKIAGIEDPIIKTVDFETLDESFKQKAILAGMNSRVAIAVGGLVDSTGIVEAINKQFELFFSGVYVTRTAKEDKALPDIIVAWMTVVGAVPSESQKYIDSWNSRDDASKLQITNNKDVITELVKIAALKKIAKKNKSETIFEGADSLGL